MTNPILNLKDSRVNECNGDFAPTTNERKQAGLEMMYELAG
jgi:hypothetical protein